MAALAVALLPVLLLGALQSAIAFRGESARLTTTLSQAAESGASVARARLEAADVLLETLARDLGEALGAGGASRATKTSSASTGGAGSPARPGTCPSTRPGRSASGSKGSPRAAGW
jgi:hypothetical protein